MAHAKDHSTQTVAVHVNTVYAKSDQATIPAAQAKAIKVAIERLRDWVSKN